MTSLTDKYVSLYINKKLKNPLLGIKFMEFNVEVEDQLIENLSLPEGVTKSIISTDEYMEVIEYEYNNLDIFAVVPRKGFGIIVSDKKEIFIEKLNKAIRKAKKRAKKYSVDGKVCVPYKSYLTREIEINCLSEEEYISSEIVNIIAEFYL